MGCEGLLSTWWLSRRERMLCLHWQRGFVWSIGNKNKSRWKDWITCKEIPHLIPFPFSFVENQIKLTPDCTPGILLQTSPWDGRFFGPRQGAESPPGTSLVRRQSLFPGSPFDRRRRTSPLYWNGHYHRGIPPPGSKQSSTQRSGCTSPPQRPCRVVSLELNITCLYD